MRVKWLVWRVRLREEKRREEKRREEKRREKVREGKTRTNEDEEWEERGVKNKIRRNRQKI